MTDEKNRIVSGGTITEDIESELSIRPKWISEYIGQHKAKEKLKIFVKAAKG